MRFRPEQHLRRQSDIRAVREQGRRVECGAFTLWWLARPTPPAAAVAAPGVRVCVVASTAAVGNAVRRNRAKRRLREVFRRHQEKLGAGLDLMLIARAASNRVEFSQLERNFVTACEKIAPSRHA
jgi:ribonuclease P protein component